MVYRKPRTTPYTQHKQSEDRRKRKPEKERASERANEWTNEKNNTQTYCVYVEH